jgi:GrpB-like predicted nucleotidyltransferase (UPF0157 family)
MATRKGTSGARTQNAGRRAGPKKSAPRAPKRTATDQDAAGWCRQVAVVPHHPGWSKTYSQARREVEGAIKGVGLGKVVVAIEHVGSTAVPGLSAKPVVDLMVGLARHEDLATFPRQVFSGLGYFPVRFGNPSVARYRQLYLRRTGAATNVHVVAYGRALWRGLLATRDFLRAYPREANRYEQLKKLLAARYPDDLHGYTRAKSPYVAKLNRKALIWRYQNAAGGAMPLAALQSASAGYGAGGTGGAGQGPVVWDGGTWTIGVWYTRGADLRWTISPDQNPRDDGAVGLYVRYDGASLWEIYYNGPDRGSDTAIVGDPNSSLGPNAYGQWTVINPDGTRTTWEHYPSDYPLDEIPAPPGGELWLNPDGSLTVKYPGPQYFGDVRWPGWLVPDDTEPRTEPIRVASREDAGDTGDPPVIISGPGDLGGFGTPPAPPPPGDPGSDTPPGDDPGSDAPPQEDDGGGDGGGDPWNNYEGINPP